MDKKCAVCGELIANGYLCKDCLDKAVRRDKKIDFRKNASGCADPTFFEAMKNLDAESDQVRKLVKCIKRLCEDEGFTIDNRIAIKSNRTGKVYK